MKELNAIGMVEYNSLARGIAGADAMVKVSAVEIIEAVPTCPGKYTVIVGGDVAAVEASVEAGVEAGCENVIDRFVIPNVHPQVFPAILGTSEVKEFEALGIIETFTAASAIYAADAAIKAANVDLIEIRLAKGLGGKALITLTGDVAAVEAAVETGAYTAEKEGLLVCQVVIPSPHQSIKKFIL